MFKKIKINVNTLTPLYIGGTDSEIPISEYVKKTEVDSKGKSVVQLLRMNKRYYIKYMQESGRSFEKFIDKISDYKKDIEYIYSCKKGLGFNENTARTIRAHIRTVDGKLMIPGSSIKGAFRNAINYYFLKNDDKFILDLNNYVSDAIRRRQINRYTKKTYNNDLKKLYDKIEQNLISKKINGNIQNRDFLRVLRFEDIILENIEANIYGVRIFHLTNNKFEVKKGAPIYLEAIPRDINFTITISYDEWLASKMGNLITPKDIEKILKTYYNDIKEKDYLLNFTEKTYSINFKDAFNNNFEYEVENDNHLSSFKTILKMIKDMGNIRIGNSSGWNYVSLFNLLNEENKIALRNKLYRDHGNLPSPASRKLIVYKNEDAFSPLGWIKINNIEVE
ncbi:type III-A CRISPR-associated RAMP protein Csm5 [Marinitoga litoralis]|uniref:type III-A CRISPR-associated RAMP protein Csm5 n=1 Tax=Marinitoga litoralis TaxID=570855 RepID=UPI001961AF96|nr:type III-A CRISPR-associated RAMP protein Csm5 [Marinitoga litoralis]MBM7558352.1 CRISPR type III-A-associated RAMP protein Csm5 [Marinitoga litoralis]